MIINFKHFKLENHQNVLKIQKNCAFFSFYLSYIHIIISRGQDQERFCSASLKNCCVGIHLYIGNLIFFHPTRLFRPTRLIFLQNHLPNMLIQDNTSIRDIRVWGPPLNNFFFWFLMGSNNNRYSWRFVILAFFWPFLADFHVFVISAKNPETKTIFPYRKMRAFRIWSQI